ncbi:DUF934 domain-containing protein [Congregibacter variabilis]|uniref:DUF934 domain-containing protein n=1 Tax=Congregibacter variabilis TaxID=3081200 RepID=A0ABZ0I3R2_9GAMM|nr:DUF934 domain-containing protein [Congregibacter sp. IMCC43200]
MENLEQGPGATLRTTSDALQSYTLQHWVEAGKPASCAVEVAGEDDLAPHYPALVLVSRITIYFAGFMDGRGFSHAGKLRQLGFTGELFADGDVLPDQWVFLERCGFDAIRGGEVASSAHALPGFTERYQADARELDPLFRRKRSA